MNVVASNNPGTSSNLIWFDLDLTLIWSELIMILNLIWSELILTWLDLIWTDLELDVIWSELALEQSPDTASLPQVLWNYITERDGRLISQTCMRSSQYCFHSDCCLLIRDSVVWLPLPVPQSVSPNVLRQHTDPEIPAKEKSSDSLWKHRWDGSTEEPNTHQLCSAVARGHLWRHLCPVVLSERWKESRWLMIGYGIMMRKASTHVAAITR